MTDIKIRGMTADEVGELYEHIIVMLERDNARAHEYGSSEDMGELYAAKMYQGSSICLDNIKRKLQSILARTGEK